MEANYFHILEVQVRVVKYIWRFPVFFLDDPPLKPSSPAHFFEELFFSVSGDFLKSLEIIIFLLVTIQKSTILEGVCFVSQNSV